MFDEHFEAVLADTEEARSIHYRIRYQVFCAETHFEDSKCFPDGLEKDAYDKNAVHFIVRHRATGRWIAAMRLVLGCHGPLPTERICDDLDACLVSPLNHDTVAEISRLCMVEEFRRRRHEGFFPYEVIDGRTGARALPNQERRKEPEILLGLMRALYSWSSRNGIEHCFFLITPSLARVIGRLHINLQAVGGPCEHRGTRVPYVADIEAGRDQLLNGCAQMAELMQSEHAYTLYSELDLRKHTNASVQ